jgi:hypothetical protein
VLICYAPTKDAGAEIKDAFYDQPQASMECIPAHDMVRILGDLDTKVGSENTGREHVMGKHGIGTINDNGEKLVEFCEENNLLIGDTLFFFSLAQTHSQNNVDTTRRIPPKTR